MSFNLELASCCDRDTWMAVMRMFYLLPLEIDLPLQLACWNQLASLREQCVGWSRREVDWYAISTPVD